MFSTRQCTGSGGHPSGNLIPQIRIRIRIYIYIYIYISREDPSSSEVAGLKLWLLTPN